MRAMRLAPRTAVGHLSRHPLSRNVVAEIQTPLADALQGQTTASSGAAAWASCGSPTT